jgi:hypothetical protein
MSSAKVSRPLRVNARMRPTDVLPPMLQRTSTHCLAGSGARSSRSPSPKLPGGWSVHAALPAVVGPRTLSIRRVLPEREVGRAAPRAPCRPAPCPPVLSHRRPTTRSRDRLGRTPRERDPTYLDPDAFRLQGPSPGRPPDRSFAAAPGVLMLFAKPTQRPAPLGPCPCRPLMADRHPRGPRTTCQRLQPNTTHEHTRDLPNLAHGRDHVDSLSCHSSIPPAIPEWNHALSDNDPSVDCQRARVSSPEPFRAPHRLAEPTLGRSACEQKRGTGPEASLTAPRAPPVAYPAGTRFDSHRMPITKSA